MTPQNDIEEEIRRQMLAEQAPPPPPAPDPPPYYAQRKRGSGGLAGIGAALLALLAKFKVLLIGLKVLSLGKLLLTFGSMFVSMWFWASLYGWPFGVGLVLLLFLHECGHALAVRLRGRSISAMVFVPFFGAYVTRGAGRDVVDDAFVAIMGPLAGALSGLACVGIYALTLSPFWLALGQWAFLINLLNLAPTIPLDGGRVVSVFSPKLMAVGLICLLFLVPLNPIIGLLALLGLPYVIAAWRADPRTQPYFSATATDRLNFGIAYVGLALFLTLGQYGATQYLMTRHLPF